jgi:hypothetical protein
LAAKYGPYVAFNDTGATMDFDALETAAEGQTYVALYPDSETAQHVSQWTIDHGVPRAVPADELHATMFQLNRPQRPRGRRDRSIQLSSSLTVSALDRISNRIA